MNWPKKTDAQMMKDAAGTIEYLEKELQQARDERFKLQDRISFLLFGPTEPVTMNRLYPENSLSAELRTRADEIEAKS